MQNNYASCCVLLWNVAPCFKVWTYVESVGKQNTRENKIKESVIMFIPALSVCLFVFLLSCYCSNIFLCIFECVFVFSSDSCQNICFTNNLRIETWLPDSVAAEPKDSLAQIKNSVLCLEPLPCSCRHFSQYHFFISTWMLSSYHCVNIPSEHLSRGSDATVLYAFFICPILTECPEHLFQYHGNVRWPVSITEFFCK
jgi:hypothetical protein